MASDFISTVKPTTAQAAFNAVGPDASVISCKIIIYLVTVQNILIHLPVFDVKRTSSAHVLLSFLFNLPTLSLNLNLNITDTESTSG